MRRGSWGAGKGGAEAKNPRLDYGQATLQLLTAGISPALVSVEERTGPGQEYSKTSAALQRPRTQELQPKILGSSRSTMPQAIEAQLTIQTTVQGGPAVSKRAASAANTEAQ